MTTRADGTVIACQGDNDHYFATVPATGHWVRLDLGPPYISVPMCTDCQISIVRRTAESGRPDYRYEIRAVTARAPRRTLPT